MLPIFHVFYLVSSHPVFISGLMYIQIEVTVSACCKYPGMLIQPSSTPDTGLNFLKNW